MVKKKSCASGRFIYTRPGSIFNSRPQLFRMIGAGLQRFSLAFLWSLLILEGLHSSGCKG